MFYSFSTAQIEFSSKEAGVIKQKNFLFVEYPTYQM